METDGNLVPPPNDHCNRENNLPKRGAENSNTDSHEGVSYTFPDELIDLIADRVAQNMKRDTPLHLIDQREDEHKKSFQGLNPRERHGSRERSATPRRSRSRSHNKSNKKSLCNPRMRHDSRERSATPRQSRSRSHGKSHR